MMCGSDYCQTCENPHVEAWAKGERHDRPIFGDGAQYRVATGKRKVVFFRALATSLDAVKHFPEWQAMVLSSASKPDSELWAPLAKSHKMFKAFVQQEHVAPFFRECRAADRTSRKDALRLFLSEQRCLARIALYAFRFRVPYDRVVAALETPKPSLAA